MDDKTKDKAKTPRKPRVPRFEDTDPEGHLAKRKKRASCDRCNHKMYIFDIHKCCPTHRMPPTNCDGDRFTCLECDKWPPVQRRALKWARDTSVARSHGKLKPPESVATSSESRLNPAITLATSSEGPLSSMIRTQVITATNPVAKGKRPKLAFTIKSKSKSTMSGPALSKPDTRVSMPPLLNQLPPPMFTVTGSLFSCCQATNYGQAEAPSHNMSTVTKAQLKQGAQISTQDNTQSPKDSVKATTVRETENIDPQQGSDAAINLAGDTGATTPQTVTITTSVEQPMSQDLINIPKDKLLVGLEANIPPDDNPQPYDFAPGLFPDSLSNEQTVSQAIQRPIMHVAEQPTHAQSDQSLASQASQAPLSTTPATQPSQASGHDSQSCRIVQDPSGQFYIILTQPPNKQPLPQTPTQSNVAHTEAPAQSNVSRTQEHHQLSSKGTQPNTGSQQQGMPPLTFHRQSVDISQPHQEATHNLIPPALSQRPMRYFTQPILPPRQSDSYTVSEQDYVRESQEEDDSDDQDCQDNTDQSDNESVYENYPRPDLDMDSLANPGCESTTDNPGQSQPTQLQNLINDMDTMKAALNALCRAQGVPFPTRGQDGTDSVTSQPAFPSPHWPSTQGKSTPVDTQSVASSAISGPIQSAIANTKIYTESRSSKRASTHASPRLPPQKSSLPVPPTLETAQDSQSLEQQEAGFGYSSINYFMKSLFASEYAWPEIQEKDQPVKGLAHQLLPQTTRPQTTSEVEHLPPTPLQGQAMRIATFKLQGRPHTGDDGPGSRQPSQYAPEHYPILSTNQSEQLAQDFKRRGKELAEFPPAQAHPHVPDTSLKMGGFMQSGAAIHGQAHRFSFYDPYEAKSSNKDKQTAESQQLRYLGAANHLEDSVSIPVKTVKSWEEAMQLWIVLLARMEWFQLSQLMLIQRLTDDQGNPRPLTADETKLLTNLFADAAKDVDRMSPVAVNCLADMTLARRDAVIQKLKSGKVTASKAYKNFHQQKNALACLNDEHYDYFQLLRMAPLFGPQLFPARHAQDFVEASLQSLKQRQTDRRPIPRFPDAEPPPFRSNQPKNFNKTRYRGRRPPSYYEEPDQRPPPPPPLPPRSQNNQKRGQGRKRQLDYPPPPPKRHKGNKGKQFYQGQSDFEDQRNFRRQQHKRHQQQRWRQQQRNQQFHSSQGSYGGPRGPQGGRH